MRVWVHACVGVSKCVWVHACVGVSKCVCVRECVGVSKCVCVRECVGVHVCVGVNKCVCVHTSSYHSSRVQGRTVERGGLWTVWDSTRWSSGFLK